MYDIVEILDEKHITPTREMTVTLAKCCRCGATRRILLQNVQKANRQRKEHCAACIEDTFHRMTETRFWSIWKGMKGRATDPNNPDYARYGAAGRGISGEWMSFENFYRDMFPSYEDGLTIERIDNSKGYYNGNCRWATNMEQQSNKLNNRVIRYQGRDMHLAEFCRVAGVSRGAITPRLNLGLSAEAALADYAASTYKKGRRPRTPKSTT